MIVYKKYFKSCNGCTDRYAGCHGSCEKYIADKEEYDAAKNGIYNEKNKEYLAVDGQIRSVMRHKR